MSDHLAHKAGNTRLGAVRLSKFMSATASRSSLLPLGVVALVIASIAVRLVAALRLDGPWIAPDEMVYAISGRSFWETGHLGVFNAGEVFYGLYPIIAGLPIAALGPDSGQVALKVAQAVIVSASIAVTYAWARRVASEGWALFAAALTAALPAFAYSGLIMTESVFLTAALLSVWLLARALETRSTLDQLLAVSSVVVATMARLQGLTLVPTFALAVVLMTLFGRDRKALRWYMPMIGGLGVITALWIIIHARVSHTSSIGAYSAVASGNYDVSDALTWIVRTLGDLFLIVLFAPLIAALILAASAIRNREADRAVRALLASSLSYGAVTVVTVGVFSSAYVGGLAERNVVSAAPAFFVAFAAWLHRGAVRPQPTTAVVAWLAAVPVLLLPVRDLVIDSALPDAFMAAPLLLLRNHSSSLGLDIGWSLLAGGIIMLFVFIPRRAVLVVPACVLLALVATSVLAQREVERRVADNRSIFFGDASRDWIDKATNDASAYLYDDDPVWNVVWQQAFWNERLRTVVSLAPDDPLPGAPDVRSVQALSDGRLVYEDGSALQTRTIAAPSTITLVGTRVATLRQGHDQPGQALWHVATPPRLAMRVQGLIWDGTLIGKATVTVFDCRHGAVEVTLAKQNTDSVVQFSSPGFRPAIVSVPAGKWWRGAIPTPSSAVGHGTCLVELSPLSGPARAAQIAFAHGSSHQDAAIVPATTFPTARVGYCLAGTFFDLLYGQPRRDARYRGAKLASFIEGKGLTCEEPPADYKLRGRATSAQGVPPHLYRYYAP